MPIPDGRAALKAQVTPDLKERTKIYEESGLLGKEVPTCPLFRASSRL
jgi:hypothetical protein